MLHMLLSLNFRLLPSIANIFFHCLMTGLQFYIIFAAYKLRNQCFLFYFSPFFCKYLTHIHSLISMIDKICTFLHCRNNWAHKIWDQRSKIRCWKTRARWFFYCRRKYPAEKAWCWGGGDWRTCKKEGGMPFKL